MAREKLSGIYCIRNTVNDKRYIGQSRNIRKRWNDHQRDLRRGMHANRMLQSAYNKYGAGVFVYEVLCECGCEALNENEIRLIALYDAFGDNGYNLTSGGDGYGDLNVTKDNASKRKSVVCFNTGRQYNSIKEAAADYGISPSSVRLCCVHKCRRGGYIPNTKTPLVWFFREEYDALTDEQRAEIVDYVENSQDRRYMKSVLEAHERKVVCLNDGSAYISIKKAAEQTGLCQSSIRECCSGKFIRGGRDAATGEHLVWRYACDADRLSPSEIAQAVLLAQNPPKKKKLTGREVCVTCITTGATYPSAQAAANEYGISAAGIIGACRGRYAYSGKHPQTGERLVWEYTEKTA